MGLRWKALLAAARWADTFCSLQAVREYEVEIYITSDFARLYSLLRSPLVFVFLLSFHLSYPTIDTIMTKPKITLYFDLHSPFAYLAFHVLRVRLDTFTNDGSIDISIERCQIQGL